MDKKLKVLRVSEDVHSEAKLKAVKLGISLEEYITRLIKQDK